MSTFGMSLRVTIISLVLHAVAQTCTGVEYEICTTGAITTGGPNEVGFISPPAPGDYGNGRDCKLQITTCATCQLQLEIVQLSFLPCVGSLPPFAYGCRSQCQDFIMFQEPDYHDTTTSYISNTSTLGVLNNTISRRLSFHFCLSSKANFLLKFSVQEKVEVYSGKNGVSGSFTSPEFPFGYKLSGDVFKYVINNTNRGYIQLQFTDWNLADKTKITIYHASTNYSLSRYGNASRPFVRSQGSTLIIKFETGQDDYGTVYHSRYLGFRAQYTFTAQQQWPSKPYNYDCGKFYTLTWGGSFEFNTDICPAGEIVDCIWVVTRYPEPAFSDYIWMRIYDLSMDISDQLEIRSGNNSQGTLLKKLADFTSTTSDFVESDAIYVHLRATCKVDRFFKVAFASYDNAQENHDYHTFDCPRGGHFACNNKKCISDELKCDGVNHCDDWSDERNCAVSTPTCRACRNKMGQYCSNQICDGYQQCTDGTDEENCRGVSSPAPSDSKGQDHYYWGTITPVVLICLILGIITCIVISYYVRRKRLLRERSRCVGRTRPQGTSRHAGVIDSLGLQAGIYGVPPPTYDEAMIAQYIPGQGTINTAFDGALDFPVEPPPYAPKCDNHLPSQYLPPYVMYSNSSSQSGTSEGSSAQPSTAAPNVSQPASSQSASGDNVGHIEIISRVPPPPRPPAPRVHSQTSCDSLQSPRDGPEGPRSGPQQPTNNTPAAREHSQSPNEQLPTVGDRTQRPSMQAEDIQAALGGRRSTSRSQSRSSSAGSSPGQTTPTAEVPSQPERPNPPQGQGRQVQNETGAEPHDNQLYNTAPQNMSQHREEPESLGQLHTTEGFVGNSTITIEETGDVFV